MKIYKIICTVQGMIVIKSEVKGQITKITTFLFTLLF